MFTTAEVTAIASVIQAGAEIGYGITFEPRNGGWVVGYITPMGGDELGAADDMVSACNAALFALDQLSPRT